MTGRLRRSRNWAADVKGGVRAIILEALVVVVVAVVALALAAVAIAVV